MEAAHRSRYRWQSLPLSLLAVLAVLAAVVLIPFGSTAKAADPLISQGKTATSSSSENSATESAAAAVDGNTATRWSSAFSDPQWIEIDLGATATVSQVVLQWEVAYGKAFQIQTSNDNTNWTSIYSTTTGTGGTQTLAVSGSGRYIRMYGTARGTQYGYSLYEFQVYGTIGGTTTPPATGTGAITSGIAGKCLDVNGANSADGTVVQVWDCNGTAAQSWTAATDGTLRALGKCLDLTGAGTANGTKAELWDCNGGGNQQWQTYNGGYRNPVSGRCLDDPNSSSTNGTQVVLWDCNGGANQQWSAPGGSGTGTTPPPNNGVCPTQSNTPNFGPNVHIFDPSMSSATIQAQLNADFAAQKDTNTAQFSNNRVAELYKPGTYSVEDNVGFYTSVEGLGLNPDDVTINGDVTVDAFNSEDAGNATQNFWREADNLAINPSSGSDRWAVAQAAPFRRIDVHGGLELYPASYGYASGGYISDTKVTGQVSSVSQQQWYSQNSNFGSWTGGVWNMVFAGVTGAPAASFPSPPETVLPTTPVSRDIPYLYVTSDGNYHVFVPSERTNASGTSWPNTPGTSLPMSTFYVVKSGDTAATINAALANGCNLFFTPGVYHVSQALNVTKAGTVVLGVGYPTIIPDGGVNAMNVADVDGVRIKGLLFAAGTTNSAALLTVGTAGSTVSHAGNPTSIQDTFFRIGGDVAGKATQSLVVNQNNALIDHVWAWRADHGNAGTVGWTVNTADTGLTVNGNNVQATGLFVEHYQKYEVIWNGTGGSIIFFQNENPYDPPNQAAWMNGSLNGYAAIKVNNSATGFQGWGWGSYCYFNVNPSVNNYHAFEVPTSGVTLHNLVTVSLGNVGTITHVVNDTGAQTPTNTTPSAVVSYP